MVGVGQTEIMRPVSAVFTAALLLFLPAALVIAQVPAPENVVVTCKNLRTVVKWDYPHHQPSTVFQIKLLGSSGLNREAYAHQFDLTEMVWSSEEQYLEYNYVTITAVTGSNSSKAVSSKSFSFNQYVTVDIKCQLEFPPVTVTVGDSGATVSVENPFHFYKELTSIRHTSDFSVTIQSGNREDVRECNLEEKTCKFSIDFPADADPCFNLTGKILKSGAKYIQFKKTGPVCATVTATGDHWLVVGVMIFIVAIVVAALTVVMCKYNAWTMKLIPTPKPLIVQPQTQQHPDFHCDPTFSSIYITGSRPPLFAPGEENSPGEAEALILAPRPYEDQDTDQDFDSDQDSSESTQSESLSLSSGSEIEMCVYETRPNMVTVEIGEGDTVTGYTGS